MKGHISCSHCNEVVSEGFFCERVNQQSSSRAQASFEVNIRTTAAFHGVGLGYTAMSNWSAMMNLPSCLSKLAYQNLQKKLYKGS